MQQEYTPHDYRAANNEELVVSAMQNCQPAAPEPPAWFTEGYASGMLEEVEKGVMLRDRGGARLVRLGQWMLQLPEYDFILVMEDEDFKRQFIQLAA